jgi:hypothetical protein
MHNQFIGVKQVKHRIIGFALSSVLLLGLNIFAADLTDGGYGAQQNSQRSPTKKEKTYPFHGTIASTDSTERTITLNGKSKKRTLFLTSRTKIIKDGHTATLKDASPGEQVSGSIFRNGDGQEEVRTLHIGKTGESKKKDVAKTSK